MKYDHAGTTATAVTGHQSRLRPPRMTLLDIFDPSFDLAPARWQPRNAGASVQNGYRKSEMQGIRV